MAPSLTAFSLSTPQVFSRSAFFGTTCVHTSSPAAPHVPSRTSIPSMSSVSESSRVSFPGLRSERFRHPFDIRATRALRSLLPIELLLRALFAAAGQVMFLSNVSTGVRVTEKQMPKLYESLKQSCKVLDMEIPQLYVRQNPQPNAYTLAVQGKPAFIVIHSSLIDLVTDDEIQAVIAHECGHLKAEHGLWITAANIIRLVTSGVLGGNIGNLASELINGQLLKWSRAAEFSCDRAALLVMQDPKIVMSALMKLAGGSRKFADELDVNEFMKQAEDFDDASRGRFGKAVRRQLSQTTHPLPVLRVRELQRWADSTYFQNLLSSGKPLP